MRRSLHERSHVTMISTQDDTDWKKVAPKAVSVPDTHILTRLDQCGLLTDS